MGKGIIGVTADLLQSFLGLDWDDSFEIVAVGMPYGGLVDITVSSNNIGDSKEPERLSPATVVLEDGHTKTFYTQEDMQKEVNNK